MSKEREITAASYIYKFYTEIQTLNHEYSNYINIMLELENKYSEEVEKAATEEEKQIIKMQVQQARYSAHQTYIHYCSIMSGMGKKTDKAIIDAYKKIKDQFMIKREDLEAYVTAINATLIHEVIQNLLETSQQIVQEIYKEDAYTKSAT